VIVKNDVFAARGSYEHGDAASTLARTPAGRNGNVFVVAVVDGEQAARDMAAA
jgi:hypothetical protein